MIHRSELLRVRGKTHEAMMNIKVTDALSVIEGLESIDPVLLEEFKRAMTDDVIPKIVSAVEKRQLQAAETREWQLKC